MNLDTGAGEPTGGGPSSNSGRANHTSLAALALHLHETDSDRLDVDIPSDFVDGLNGVQGVTLVDGKLKFATLTDRNRIVARATFEALGEQALDASALFAAAARLWRHEIGHDDTACGRLLAMVHPRSDVLAMSVAQIATTPDVFSLLHMLEKLLPLLDHLDWTALIAVSAAQHPRTDGDGAAGMFFGQVQQWLMAHPGSGAELSAVLLREPSEPLGHLLTAALLAWGADAPQAAVARAVQLSTRPESPLPAVIGRVTERMLADTHLPQEVTAPLEALVQEWLQGETPEARRRGVVAATSVLHQRRTFDTALRALASAGDPDTLGYLAFALGRHTAVFLEAGTFFDWLALCVRLPAGVAGAIRFLDSTLSRLLGSPLTHRDAVLSFLQAWIMAQPIAEQAGAEFPALFGSCAGRILEDHGLLAQVVTTWFMADARAMPEAAAQLIAGLGSEARSHRRSESPTSVGFDLVLLDSAAPSDFLFLARRLVGYVISADLLLSLALSLLRVRDAQTRVHPLMASLLGDEIGYDYPVTTVKRLGTAIDAETDATTRALLERIRDGLQRDLNRLDALPRLRELEVPLTVQRAFRKARAKQMEQHMREARKKSVLAQMVTQVHLKAGLSSFQYLHGDFTEPMTLNSLSYSFELPRRETLDPVGNAYRRHMHKMTRKDAS